MRGLWILGASVWGWLYPHSSRENCHLHAVCVMHSLHYYIAHCDYVCLEGPLLMVFWRWVAEWGEPEWRDRGTYQF